MLGPLTFLVGVAYWPWAVSATTAGRWAVLAIAVPVMLIGGGRTRMGFGHWLGLALLLYAAASAAWSPSPWDTAGAVWQLALLAGTFMLAAEIRDIGPVLDALAGAIWVSVPFVVLQSFGIDVVETTDHGDAGLFLNRDLLAEAAALALIGVAWRRRWILAAGPALCCALAGSRGVAVPLGVGLIAWALSRPWSIRSVLVVWAAAAIVLIIAVAAAHLFDHDPRAIDARLAYWDLAWINLTWAGHGLGSFAAMAPTIEYVHNEPLQLVFELGAGAGLSAALVVYAVGTADPLGRALFLALGAECLFGFPLHAPLTAYLGAVLAGYLCGTRDRARWAQSMGRAYDASRARLAPAASPAFAG